MKPLNQQTERSKYLWLDGEYKIYFESKEIANAYKIYYGGVLIPL